MSVLDKFLKDKRSELSKLKKERRKIRSSEKYKLDDPINALESLTRKFMKSKMEPRRVGNIIINYKLYVRFLKKLKGFETETVVTEKSLVLRYKKGTANKGKLELYDLTKYFEGYGDIPKAEIINE